jgi:thiol:disulfide interchange protein DsbD
VKVTVTATPSDARNEPSLFAGFDQGKVTPTATAPPSNAVPGPTPTADRTALPEAAAVAPAEHSFLGLAIGGSLPILFLFAMLGGLVLNLTPCVLPIIPIKVMTLVQHAADSKARRIYLGTWNALGVIAFWTALGVPMMFVSSFDPSRLIFGHWWVTLGLGVLIALMGLGIMGLFTLSLPQSVYLIDPKADSAKGSFLFGVMTGVLGLPCFGFVAGGLLAGAAALSPLVILAVFVGLGIGMAAPYFILTAKPKLVEKLPRTGPASDLVKQFMGLLLLAAAAFFIAVGAKSFLARYPWYADSMPYWAAAIFIAIAGLWLMGRTFAITQKWGRRIAIVLLAVLPAWGVFAFARVSAQADQRDYEARMAASEGDSKGLVPGVWLPYSAERLEAARAAGHTVVVDFTADTCLNCKFLKRTVLDRDPVRTRLNSTILLKADVTQSDAPGWKMLADLGQKGIPTLANYGPAREQPVILNSYTSQMVLDALDRVGSRPLTQKTP